MKKKTIAVLFVIMYLFFVGLLDYPYVARIINAQMQGQVINSYEKMSDEVTEKEQMFLEAEAYNKSLANGATTILDAFAAEKDEDDAYYTLLDIGVDGTMGTISIPAINITLPIYHGTSEDVLQKGAGHLQGTSLPVGGLGTHTAISAHRGLPRKTMFTNLDLLKEGDVFYFTILDRKLAYQVYAIETVEPTNIEPLKIVPDRDLATLITCTPYGINSHRMYVHAERIPYEETAAEEVVVMENPETWLTMYWWIPVTILLLIIMLFILWYYLKPEKKRKEK